MRIKSFFRVKGNTVVTHGRNVNSLFGSPTWEGHMYAVRLDFSPATGSPQSRRDE